MEQETHHNEEEALACPICLEPAGNMVAGECQHAVCISCVRQLLSSERSKRLCPMCRAELRVGDLKYVENGVDLSDEDDFQKWQKEEEAGEGALLIKSGRRPDAPTRADWLVLGVCGVFVVLIYALAAVLQARAAESHVEYYNEQVFLNQPLACTPVMPHDCADNGRLQCQEAPVDSSSFPNTNEGPLTLARCDTQNGTVYQKYAWTTVTGTGNWIAASRNLPIMCANDHLNDYHMEVYFGDCTKGQGFSRNCEDDPECPIFTDARQVRWLSEEGVDYYILDERFDNRPLMRDPNHFLVSWDMRIPSNQLCRNAELLNSDGLAHDLKVVEAQEKPRFTMCGLELSREDGSWYTIRGKGKPLTAKVCAPRADRMVKLNMVVFEEHNCDDLFSLQEEDDPGCIATRLTQFQDCEILTWDTGRGRLYTLFLSGGGGPKWGGGSITITQEEERKL
jgi:hypothetical protein